MSEIELSNDPRTPNSVDLFVKVEPFKRTYEHGYHIIVRGVVPEPYLVFVDQWLLPLRQDRQGLYIGDPDWRPTVQREGDEVTTTFTFLYDQPGIRQDYRVAVFIAINDVTTDTDHAHVLCRGQFIWKEKDSRVLCIRGEMGLQFHLAEA
jgi:hypothetical protein